MFLPAFRTLTPGALGGPLAAMLAGLSADGVLQKLDRLWILAQTTNTLARTDLVAGALASAVNGPTFTTNRGYTGDGLGAYLNLGIAPSATTKATQDSFCFFQWVQNYDPGSNVWFGCEDGSVMRGIAPDASGRVNAQINTGTSTNISTGNGAGFYAVDRSASNLTTAYKNGVSLGTAADVSSGRPAVSIFALAESNNGSARFFGTSRLSCVGVSQSLGDAGQAALYSRVNAYMTATGVP